MRTAFCLCILAVALVATAQDVVVNKAPPKIERKTFDPNDLPNPKPPLHHGEIAACEYLFRIEVDLRYLPERMTPGKGAARIHKVVVRLSMPIVIWLPRGADEHLKAHEETHRLIAEHFYKDADKVARKLAGELIGKAYEGQGVNDQAIIGSALEKAARELSEKYIAQVKEPCVKVQDQYDQLTDHGNNRDLKSEDAMKKVLQSK